jgi:hypothetical protein
MHSYFAFGLGIHSDIELPELRPVPANPDIAVRLGHVDSSGIEQIEFTVCYADEDMLRVWYDRVGGFAICRGAEIVVEPAPDANLQELRLTLLGAVFAMLLHQRGHLVLHASVVARADRAVAFLAEAGGGKSTTAAAMLTRGYQLVADDLLALQPDPAKLPTVFPAFPFLKVSPDAAHALGANIEAAPRVNMRLEKRVWQISDVRPSPVTLHSIYVLDRAARLGIQPLEPRQAFIELVRHTFVIHLLDVTNASQNHFRQCSVLAGKVQISKLHIPSALDSLADAAEMIDTDFTRTASLL